ncbi:hypothetical protein TRICI_001878 [Trichomonascus ciferrii]|uniref:Phospholipase C n=1 Tax=Trichomonascus ciferrii TaxID=44093 RepID=A0A642V835_9ASCO|nr:hypothetical protein TRICI_001878 [Trichomonascus ciferrii]
MLFSYLASLSLAAAGVAGKGLSDINHVVLFMQENRAFDHYYGSVSGVRGFKDPNVKVRENGKPIWYQPTNNTKADYLLPWYLSEDKEYSESNQCIVGGTNSWTDNHNAWNDGKMDGWATNNTAYSWGYFRRSDIPTHFSIVEGWTVADMYSESIIASTSPNRVSWVSGTINSPGAAPGDPETNGGPYIDNYNTPGCEESEDGRKYSCYPLKWKTTPELIEDAGVDWFVFQDENNFDDNPLAWFEQFQKAKNGSSLQVKGNSFPGLQSFYDKAASGSLPAISYIVGPMELSEHPPWSPKDGAWLQEKVVEAVMNSPKYNETALIISYDETGGFGDHVSPFVSPKGTKGEWMKDLIDDPKKDVPIGPGFRVPMYVISPWTRGGKVFTSPSDHSSQIMFLEEWVKAKFGKDIYNPLVNAWRRDHMSNLTEIFDFENPDTSLPELVKAEEPETSDGEYVGTSRCQKKYNERQPPIPYGNQNESYSLWVEEGYKQVTGHLTEGRYLVFESNGSCITGLDGKLSLGDCGRNYQSESARFVLHQQGDVFSKIFKLESNGGRYLKGKSFSQNDGDPFDIQFSPSKGYTIRSIDDKYISVDGNSISYESTPYYFTVYSVSY